MNEEYTTLEADLRESQTESEQEWDEVIDEKMILSEIRASADYAISFFQRGRESDAIADLVFIRNNADKLLQQ